MRQKHFTKYTIIPLNQTPVMPLPSPEGVDEPSFFVNSLEFGLVQLRFLDLASRQVTVRLQQLFHLRPVVVHDRLQHRTD